MTYESLPAKSVRYMLLLVPLICLLVLAYMGTFSRYMSDDYHTAYNLETRGYWGMQEYYWTLWTGRFSFIALLGIVESLGMGIVPFLPGLLVASMYSAFGWAAFRLLVLLGVQKPIVPSLSLAGLIIWISIRSLSLYPEILFWQTGIINYALSPILVALIAGFLIKRFRNDEVVHWSEILLWLVFTFISGGFSEGAVAIQIIFLGAAFLALAARFSHHQKNGLILVGAGVAGSLLSLALMTAAPGNLARALHKNVDLGLFVAQENIGNVGGLILTLNLEERLAAALTHTCTLMLNWVANRTIIASLALLSGIFIGLSYDVKEKGYDLKSAIKYIFAAGLFVFLAFFAGVAPSFIVRGFAPPERALFLPMFFLVSLAVSYGWIVARLMIHAGRLKSSLIWIQNGIAGVLILQLMFGPGTTLISNIRLIPVLRAYADMWDERDRFFRQSVADGDRSVLVKNINRVKELSDLHADSIWKVGDYTNDPDYWINKSAAQYYGLVEIVAR